MQQKAFENQSPLRSYNDLADNTTRGQQDSALEQQLNQLSNDDAKKHGKWSQEEDELLRTIVEEYGERQWRKISERITGRTAIQCLHRWTKILKPGLVKGPWTKEEDGKLLEWVQREGPTKWAQAASYIKGRNGKQCRERWFNSLDPELNKGKWTAEEDKLFYKLYQQYGSSWSKIAKMLPGRTENAIKNRFYSTLRKIAADQKKGTGDSPGPKGHPEISEQMEQAPNPPIEPVSVTTLKSMEFEQPQPVIVPPQPLQQQPIPTQTSRLAMPSFAEGMINEMQQLMLAKNFLYLRLTEHQKSIRERMHKMNEAKSQEAEEHSQPKQGKARKAMKEYLAKREKEGVNRSNCSDHPDTDSFLDHFLDQVETLLKTGVNQRDINQLRLNLQEYLSRLARCQSNDTDEPKGQKGTPTRGCGGLSSEEVSILLKLLSNSMNTQPLHQTPSPLTKPMAVLQAPPQLLYVPRPPTPTISDFFQILPKELPPMLTSNIHLKMNALAGRLHNVDSMLSSARKEMFKLEMHGSDTEENHANNRKTSHVHARIEEEKIPARVTIASVGRSNHEISSEPIIGEEVRRRKSSYDILDELLNDSKKMHRPHIEESLDISSRFFELFSDFTSNPK